MADQDQVCVVTMQPWNNWRGALEVKDSSGVVHVLNSRTNQYTSPLPVKEVYEVANVTDIYWAWNESEGQWYEDSHYEVENCELQSSYNAVPGKQDSITIVLKQTPTTSTSVPVTVQETIPPTLQSNPSTTTTQVLTPTTEQSLILLSTVETLPVTGPREVNAEVTTGIAMLLGGVLAIITSRMRKTRTS